MSGAWELFGGDGDDRVLLLAWRMGDGIELRVEEWCERVAGSLLIRSLRAGFVVTAENEEAEEEEEEAEDEGEAAEDIDTAAAGATLISNF